ncbi:L-seryl-tRNA(Sec) selenium transferase, partial [Escherichia coli]|nr:L-seryl-tRNA(Sec) selenium transferase [Escherichia coli]
STCCTRATENPKVTPGLMRQTLTDPRLYIERGDASRRPGASARRQRRMFIRDRALRLQALLAAHYGAEFAVQVMPCLSQIGRLSLLVVRLPSAGLTFTNHD